MIITIVTFSTDRTKFKFKNTEIINLKTSRKHNGVRSIQGTIKNKTTKTITVEYEVLYKDTDRDRYTIVVARPMFYDIPPKGMITFRNKGLIVNELTGTDFIVREKKVYKVN